MTQLSGVSTQMIRLMYLSKCKEEIVLYMDLIVMHTSTTIHKNTLIPTGSSSMQLQAESVLS